MAQDNTGMILVLGFGAYLAYESGLFNSLLGATAPTTSPTTTPVTTTPVTTPPPATPPPVTNPAGQFGSCSGSSCSCSNSAWNAMAQALVQAIVAAGDPAYVGGQASGWVWNVYATNLGGQAVNNWSAAVAGAPMDVCTYMNYVAQAGLPVNLTGGSGTSSGESGTNSGGSKGRRVGTAMRGYSIAGIHGLRVRPTLQGSW